MSAVARHQADEGQQQQVHPTGHGAHHQLRRRTRIHLNCDVPGPHTARPPINQSISQPIYQWLILMAIGRAWQRWEASTRGRARHGSEGHNPASLPTSLPPPPHVHCNTTYSPSASRQLPAMPATWFRAANRTPCSTLRRTSLGVRPRETKMIKAPLGVGVRGGG
jgi:hypothetical protein